MAKVIENKIILLSFEYFNINDGIYLYILDYFYYLKKFFPNIKLLLFYKTTKFLDNFINLMKTYYNYNIQQDLLKTQVGQIDNEEIIFNNCVLFSSLFEFWMFYKLEYIENKKFNNCKFVAYKNTSIDYFYDIKNIFNNIIILKSKKDNDFIKNSINEEMYINYENKRFDIPRKFEDNLLINTNYIERLNIEKIKNFVLNYNKNIICVGNTKLPFCNKYILSDFFIHKYFSQLLYAKNRIEYFNRFIPECAYFNKKIIFLEKNSIIKFRYLQALEHNFNIENSKIKKIIGDLI